MTPRAAFFLGCRALAPLLLGTVPFGLLYGVVALQAGLSPTAAVAMSTVVFAGSAQFVLAQLLGAGAPALVMLATVTLINLRHLLYSASVAPVLAGRNRLWKALLAYLLTDEAYAAAIPHLLDGAKQGQAHWILLGAGFSLWSGWQLATVVGVVLGSQLPPDLPLDFAATLTFIAIAVPLIRHRSQAVAALVAGTVAVLGAVWPYKLGLFVAALAGLGAGALFLPRRAVPGGQKVRHG